MSKPFSISILRVVSNSKSTMGEFYVDDELIAMSLELPWLDNQSNASSVPEGLYSAILRYDKSRDGFFTIELRGTGPRTGIQIHVGNKPDDITGCILIGLTAKYGEHSVGKSKLAIERLKEIFYESTDPIQSPDKTISVRISSAKQPIKYYASASDKSFYWYYEDGYWNGVGGTSPSRFLDYVRDAHWIIAKGLSGSSFEDRFVRWGTLGNTPFQTSKDLKSWTTIAPEETITRIPLSSNQVWEILKSKGGAVKLIFQSAGVDKNPALPVELEADIDPVTDAEDGAHDGVIHIDFSEPEFDGDVISIDDSGDTYDDYSGDDDSDYDDGGRDDDGGWGDDGGGRDE